MIHTFALIKFIFISELTKSEAFDIKKYAEKDFYMQVFSSLLYNTRNLPPTKSTKTKEFKALIKKYVNEYCELCGYIYTPIELKFSQQISAYEDTAYKNGIILQFRNKLRMSINLLTRQKERTAARRKALKKQKVAEGDIN